MKNIAVVKAVRNMIQFSVSTECRGSLFATKSRCSPGSFFSYRSGKLDPKCPKPVGTLEHKLGFCFLPCWEGGEEGLWRATPLGRARWSTAIPCLCSWCSGVRPQYAMLLPPLWVAWCWDHPSGVRSGEFA